MRLRRVVSFAILAVFATAEQVSAQTLDQQLQQVGAAELAKLAREQGDDVRGAVVFFQPHMACSKCHSVGDGNSPLGPDLATLGQEVTDEQLVESILFPSKVIRKGYESIAVALNDGRILLGLLSERTADKVSLRDIERHGELTTVAAADISEIKASSVSIMPDQLVNQLASRQQFFDLVRYLIEIREGGAPRARALQPSAALLTFAVPEYEQRIDHAGLIRDWNSDSLTRGAAIYQRVCANCHGTKDQPGSLPTSPRFAQGVFKNGSDPLSMYHTLTRGFGLMPAQTWMVPSQKYDVIHYIRETYLREQNPTQFVPVDDAYVARLPKGDTRGPMPSRIEPWSAMDYGPSLTHTYEVPGGPLNLAYKGVAVRLDPGAGGVSRGRHWSLFDIDTFRVAAIWSSSGSNPNFIDWRGIQFNGEHQIHPRIAGQVVLTNSIGPGWADPIRGEFRDERRVEGRDGRRYGPLPRNWARFRGLFHHGQQVILSYTVGTTNVLESPRLFSVDDPGAGPLNLRVMNIGPRQHDLVLQVAEHAGAAKAVAELRAQSGRSGRAQPLRLTVEKNRTNAPTNSLSVQILPRDTPVEWAARDGRLQLKIPAGSEPLHFAIQTAIAGDAEVSRSSAFAAPLAAEDLDLAPLTRGGPPRWPERLHTPAIIGSDDGPFAVDVLTAPESNPWLAQTRFTGLDCFADGRIAVCTWDGDVWIVELDRTERDVGTETDIGPDSAYSHKNSRSIGLTWRRIASGLFQPLGLKIVRDQVHVLCRDQLAVLHDVNSDGETDYYECLNSDHQVTEHFHEFAMGLQIDSAGNFYYAKSARHALRALVPHHGTLLRISRDGSNTEILANGFRAANGVCLNPDGSFVVTDQEGHWNPKNRINWVTLSQSGTPKFYGNMFGYTDVTDSSDSAMEPPLCWITNDFDRSPAELLWVNSEKWGPLHGSLLNLSYGFGHVFVVPHERVHGVMQGGMLRLPLPPFPTGVMRGRFFPDGHLYLCGMFAWAGSATHPGGLYRVRATGQAMNLVRGLSATKHGLQLSFTDPLDPAAVGPDSVRIKTWSLRRSAKYGSKHYDEQTLDVRGTSLSDDRKLLTLDVPEIAPTWCMEIAYTFRAASGQPVTGVIHNTIHSLADVPAR